jgi:hypothetical protein
VWGVGCGVWGVGCGVWGRGGRVGCGRRGRGRVKARSDIGLELSVSFSPLTICCKQKVKIWLTGHGKVGVGRALAGRWRGVGWALMGPWWGLKIPSQF